MPGHEPGKACLDDHVRPRLRQPRPVKDKDGDDGYRAYAPCHDDHEPSLVVSLKHGRLVWNCFADCGQQATRNALIREGVPPECLERSAEGRAAADAAAREVLFGKLSAHHKVLMLAAIAEGYDELPRGDALAGLAGRAGVSRREAFRARSILNP